MVSLPSGRTWVASSVRSILSNFAKRRGLEDLAKGQRKEPSQAHWGAQKVSNSSAQALRRQREPLGEHSPGEKRELRCVSMP